MRLYVGVILCLGFFMLGVSAEEEPAEEEEEDETEPPPVPGPPLVPMCELVAQYGHKCEEHTVKTKDGYILEIYRIPPSTEPTGPVILLMHGLLAAGELFALKNNSIGYLLSDKGFDVWIGNYRGTYHGRKHESLNPDTDEKFWDFSFQEMGMLDSPAIINYVKEKAKTDQIYFVGHSMSGAVYFVMMDKAPETISAIKETVLLAPYVITSKYQFMMKDGGQMANMYADTMKRFEEEKRWEAFPRADVNETEHQIYCKNMPDMAVAYCNMGFDMADPVVGKFVPAGTSRRNLQHLAQSTENGRIRMYNFGSDEANTKAYGVAAPPAIDFKKATPGIHIFYAEADHIVGHEDIETLKSEVPNLKSHLFVQDENFNHIDFLFPMSEEGIPMFNQYTPKLLEIFK